MLAASSKWRPAPICALVEYGVTACDCEPWMDMCGGNWCQIAHAFSSAGTSTSVNGTPTSSCRLDCGIVADRFAGIARAGQRRALCP
eukprot:6211293-Pleurochrysis_carterae.AAC.2